MKNLLTFLVLLCGFVFLFTRGKEHYAFYGDGLGYYMYLPATFIYHNLTAMEQLPEDRGIRPFVRNYAKSLETLNRSETGKVVNQYTYGVALMELPFFLGAHLYEMARGLPANGYSETYQDALRVASLFYILLGLWFVYRSLRLFFPQAISQYTAILLLAGTNLFWFAFHHPGMSHPPLFFLLALMLYCTLQLQTRPKWWLFAGIGLCAGLITVIRPSDIVCLLLPLCYGIYNRASLRARLLFFRDHARGMLLACACFILPVVPQLLYWKMLSGHWIYDSYGPAQRFDFQHPHIWDGLTGPHNGWLAYSPLMIFALAGLLLVRKYRPLALTVWLLVPAYIYIIYSWYCYDYINGFGSRPMINIYSLLAFPLAATLQYILQQRLLIRISGIGLMLFLTAAGLSYTVQQSLGIIRSEASNAAYNRAVLFRYRLRYQDLVTYDVSRLQPDTSGLRPLAAPYLMSLPDTGAQSSRAADGSIVYAIKKGEEYPPCHISIRYSSNTMSRLRVIRCFGDFYAPESTEDMYANQLLVLQVLRGKEVLLWEGLRINNKIGKLQQDKPALFETIARQWGHVYYDVPVPAKLQDGDLIELMIWNIGKNEMLVKNPGLRMFQ